MVIDEFERKVYEFESE